MSTLSENICYIVGAADFRRGFNVAAGDLVIAADGGYDRLLSMGITPDLLIGDLDSVSADIPADIELLRFKVEKDETDMHLAFLEGMKRGYRRFRIYGGTGGRADHTFANYSLLLFAKRQGAEIRLVSDDGECLIIENESIALQRGEWQGVSVFAFCGNAENVNISGLKYEAKGVTLTSDFPLGVSNSFENLDACISVERGALLIMLRLEK